MPNFTTEQKSTAVTVISFDAEYGWEQWFLLTSDNHHDSILCDRKKEKADLDKALARDAVITNVGDFFDAMQGKFDPRRNMDELRPEYRRQDYFDFVITDSAQFLAPYAANIAHISPGNHETAIRKNANTDLTERLAFLLNMQYGGNVKVGGYGGWLVIRVVIPGTRNVFTYRIKYYHGSGGEAPVTRGIIQTNRQAVFLPDANAVINGHNHHHYLLPITRERLNAVGNQYFDMQYHVRVPGYKQSYGDGTGGWDVERGAVPKPIGAVWLKLTLTGKRLKPHFEADIIEPIPVNPTATTRPAGRLPFDDDSEYP